LMGQKNQRWWDLPAADSFQLHREIYSIPQDAFQKTLGELTELFGVAALARQPVRELSLGERMKMELIAALLHQPQLLLLDEPTIGLDVVAQVTIQKCLRDYNALRGVTMLLTSHYMRDVEALCSRVLVITHGKVVYDGPLSVESRPRPVASFAPGPPTTRTGSLVESCLLPDHMLDRNSRHELSSTVESPSGISASLPARYANWPT